MERLGFKSYYVVWKQYFISIIQRTDNKFKSYYVVWKHCRNNEISGNVGRFKSYYVVWKLIIKYIYDKEKKKV